MHRPPTAPPSAVPLLAKPSMAAAMEPMVMLMCSQLRKVRSLAKKVFGSRRMGITCVTDVCSRVHSTRW
jgi:hypothetical protein